MSKKIKNYPGVLPLLLSFCLFTIAVSAQKIGEAPPEDFKHLGGPMEEIPAMRLPDPSTLGARSKSATFPINSSDDLQEIEIPVDSAENFKLTLLSPGGKSLNLRVAPPKAGFFDLRGEAFARRIGRIETTYGVSGSQLPAEVFSFESIEPGVLRVQIEKPKNLRAAGEIIGYLVASSDSPYRLYSYVDTLETTVGRELGIAATFFNQNESSEEGKPQPMPVDISEARVLIFAPDGEKLELPMRAGGDGLFSMKFTPQIRGRYAAQVISKGSVPDGTSFTRTSEIAFEVASARAALKPNVRAGRIDDLRWRIDLPVAGIAAGAKVIAHAEIWARDAAGNEFPVSWLGGMAAAQKFSRRETIVSLTLDSRWLAQTTNAEAFVLKNVRLQDPDSSVVLGTAQTLALPNITATASAKSFAGITTEEMRQGVRPAETTNSAIGGKLMLVHGYCSGDAWGSAAAAGQFTNYVKFLDLNQNRSHDQFAQLIRNFGAALPSFGIVAHSQGGAAALHLYTYYWSGLDYATGTRLIQSVGTPYRGTALAGNLALLGQIFGAGCGANYDLAYNGAAAWLANIPTWARAKVYYHTTSFSDVWWRYDYCNVATDPFLSDPDDGVVEQNYAQLSGGINLGHKTGWCHTSGMRDPAQTNDASRNANMNANAAR